MSNIICLDRNEQVICWGDINSCEKYINQMYSLSLDNVIYDNYSTCNNYSSFYEDYEVFNVQGTSIYLTLGEIKMVREGCQSETNGIKYIQEELDHLLTLTDVYNKSIIEELLYFKNFMNELFDIHAKYNMENVFTNLDIDALHSAYQMERENKGLPIVFIK